MNLQFLHLLESAATAPAQFFLTSLWQGMLLAGAAWLGLVVAPAVARRIAPSRVSGIAPRTRFLLWMIVLALSVAVPFSTFLPAFLHSRGAEAGLAAAAPAGALTTPQISALWALVILGAWALASLFCLERLLENGWRLRSLIRHSTPFPAGRTTPELLAQLATAAPRRVELRLSQCIDGPVAAGFFQPAILVPDWLASKLTPAELGQIVMHELAHLERRDDWTNLLQKVVRALFPLNPALLWVERQLCREREMACDDAVLSGMIAPREYAACLTSLAEKRMLRNLQTLAPGAWQRRSELAERVHRILRHKNALPPLPSSAGRPVVGIFLLASLGAGLALARCPRLIHFAPAVAPPALAAAAGTAPSGTLAQEKAAHVVRTALPIPRLLQPAVQASDATALPSNAAHQAARIRAARNPLSAAHPTRIPAAANHPARSLSAAAHSVRSLQPGLFNAHYAQQGKTSAKAQGGKTQIVFTVWEIESPALPGSFHGPLAPPSFVAFSPTAGWIVFQL